MIGGATTGALFHGLAHILEGVRRKSRENQLSYIYDEIVCDPPYGYSGLGPVLSRSTQVCGVWQNGGYNSVEEMLDDVPPYGWPAVFVNKRHIPPGNYFRHQLGNRWVRVVDLPRPPGNDWRKQLDEVVPPLSPPRWLPPTLPAFVPEIDPFTAPPFETMPEPWSVPVKWARLRDKQNPWRSPSEQSDGGYNGPMHPRGVPQRDRTRLPRPRPGRPTSPAENPDVVIPIDPAPGVVQPYSPPSGGSRRPPRGTKERKFKLAVGGIPAKIISAVGETIDWIEAVHAALPKKYQAKAPEGWWRGPSPQAMVEAIYKHREHLNYREVFTNLWINQQEDRVWGKLGKINAKASNKFGRSAGFQLGPAL